jgi:hypothetical protein
MIKFALGILLGSSAVAVAEWKASDIPTTTTGLTVQLYMPAGVGPDNNIRPIPLDVDGFVICSKGEK